MLLHLILMVTGVLLVVFGPGLLCQMILHTGHPVAEAAFAFGVSAFFGGVAGWLLATILGDETPYWPIFWFFVIVVPLVITDCAHSCMVRRKTS